VLAWVGGVVVFGGFGWRLWGWFWRCRFGWLRVMGWFDWLALYVGALPQAPFFFSSFLNGEVGWRLWGRLIG